MRMWGMGKEEVLESVTDTCTRVINRGGDQLLPV